MRKIILLSDDFSEMMTLEGLLRKIGLDVLTVQRESALSDVLLGFSPDLALIVTRGGLKDVKRLSTKLLTTGFPKQPTIIEGSGTPCFGGFSTG